MASRHRGTEIVAALMFTLGIGGCAAERQLQPQQAEWRETGLDGGRTKYSPLDQINLGNVAQLEPAWIYHSGDLPPKNSAVEANPLIVGNTLYTSTGTLRIVALDATTGTQKWLFDPFAGREPGQTLNRGISYWSDGKEARILFTAGPYLYALDAQTGRQVTVFGEAGKVDLRLGLGRNPEDLYVDATSPGAVFEDLIVIGTRVGEGIISAPGDIRAYDVRTGKTRWTFHTIPHPGETGYETWPEGMWKWAGGANAWGGVSVDAGRGIIFVGTGSATYDYWGGNRLGDNLFANSTVALDARTGQRIWHYQTVRHDVWDRDLNTPPILATVRRDGRSVDAAVQLTKQGYIYVFDRETGRPLFPIEDRPVAASDLKGEQVARTQPIPLLPPPTVRQEFRLEDVNGLTPETLAANRATVSKLKLGPAFTPPSEQGTLVTPGLAGAHSWGGGAFDATTGRLFVNSSEIPMIMKMLHIEEGIMGRGKSTYLQNCAACHGADRKGSPEFPSLVGVAGRYSRRELSAILATGRGRMPGFAHLSFDDKTNLFDYLYGGEDAVGDAKGKGGAPMVPYVLNSMLDFLGPDGYPAIAPPWGTLSAINLNSGKIEWKVPLGEYEELTRRGIPPTGTKNFGGPIATAGGLVFIGATMDEKFRAFDANTGRIVWQTTLPASAFAVASTYMVDGRQYIVVPAGGGQGRKTSDIYIAFALPCRLLPHLKNCRDGPKLSP